VVRRLVNGMGGTINATPRKGGGLTVTLALVRSGGPPNARGSATPPAGGRAALLGRIPRLIQNQELDPEPGQLGGK